MLQKTRKIILFFVYFLSISSCFANSTLSIVLLRQSSNVQECKQPIPIAGIYGSIFLAHQASFTFQRLFWNLMLNSCHIAQLHLQKFDQIASIYLWESKIPSLLNSSYYKTLLGCYLLQPFIVDIKYSGRLELETF